MSYFSTGSDSPVSAASLTKRSRDDSSRTSAGIMSPADRCTMSPGTTSRSGTSRRIGLVKSFTRRWTVAVVRTIARSFSAARSERNSCTNRNSALIVTIVSRIVTLAYARFSAGAKTTSVHKLIAASTSSTYTNGLLNDRISWRAQCGGLSCAISFGPSSSSRSSACENVRPRVPTCRFFSVSSSGCADSCATRSGRTTRPYSFDA